MFFLRFGTELVVLYSMQILANVMEKPLSNCKLFYCKVPATITRIWGIDYLKGINCNQ